MEKMINEKRLLENFIRLTQFDSESFHERAIGEELVRQLEALGLSVTVDTTEQSYLEDHPDSYPSIVATLKGEAGRTPLLFAAHMDTVSPGKGKRVVERDDGILTSKGDTVLGADDISGLVSILEALRVIRERNLSHPDLEILFTAAEEPFCEGSRHLKEGLLKAREAYVLDLTGPVGTAAIQAPTILSYEITITGKAAHAGFHPEEGINALNIAVDSLKEIRTGRVDPISTVNVGTIQGGSGKNIVPGIITLTGEVRSYRDERAEQYRREIFETVSRNAKKAGGLASCCGFDHIRAYEVDRKSLVVEQFKKACRTLDLPCETVSTFGGSDGNRLNERGIPTIVLACAMEKVHSTEEYSDIKELKQSAGLCLELMTQKGE